MTRAAGPRRRSGASRFRTVRLPSEPVELPAPDLKDLLAASREAERALRREKDRLDRAARAGRVALWEWDLGTGALEWTANVDGMLGHAPGGFPRTVEAWASQVHPDDVGGVVSALDRHLNQDVPYDATYRIRRADGVYAWWRDVGWAERDASGKPYRMAGTCVDVSELKKSEEAERALLTSQRWLEETQRVARVGWYTFQPDRDLFTTSDRMDEILGIEASYPHDTAGWLALVHPDDREAAANAWREVLAGRADPDLVFRVVRPGDGQVRNLHSRASVVLDTEGRVVRVLGTTQDETEKRQAEAEVRRLAAAVEQIAQSVVITGVDGTIQYVNEAFTHVTGWPREAALGASPRLLRSGHHPAAFYENLWRTILSGATWRGRFTNRRRDGSLFEADAVITPVRDGFGNLTGFVCLQEDVTEALAVQKKLQDQEKLAAIGEIAANIAHEVKNPLFAISSGIQLLMEELVLDGDQRRTFEVIHGDVVRMDRLVRQLQLLSARRKPQLVTLPVPDLVEAAVTLNRGLAAERSLRIATRFDEGLPDVRADEDQIHQVLLNLLQNAISYSPAGGTVGVDVALRGDDRVVLTVRNEGPAIPDELVERIFDPFFTTRHPSAGMGLAISRRIALDHGGALRVASAEAGRVVFALELPVGGPP